MIQAADARQAALLVSMAVVLAVRVFRPGAANDRAAALAAHSGLGLHRFSRLHRSEERSPLVLGMENVMSRAKRPQSYQIPSGPQIRVYDNGGKTLDRYTVVIDGKDWDDSASPGMKSMLGLNSGGTGFSQFTEGQEGRHLGAVVTFQSLDEQTQRHIIGRLL